MIHWRWVPGVLIAAVVILGTATPVVADIDGHGEDQATGLPQGGGTSGGEDTGSTSVGQVADCSVVSSPTFLGLSCVSGKSGVINVAKILRKDPVPTCWHDPLTPVELTAMNVVNDAGTRWFWRRCVSGISKKPNRFSPEFEVGVVAVGDGDEVVTLTANQSALLDFAAALDGIPPPIAAVSPMARPRVGAWVSFFNGTAGQRTVRAGSVTLRARVASIKVNPLGRGIGDTLRCAGTGYRARPGDLPDTAPGCWYRYPRSSADQSDNMFPVWITAHWIVDVSADAGATWQRFNTFDKSQITTIPVTEIQALVVN
ncbi:MAG: hypothetical protein ACRCYU_10335 [Nocardioides sp.]